MNRKTIKNILRKKTNDWLGSIDDVGIRKLAEQDTIVTGGAITSMLLSEPIKDFDIYFKTRTTTKAVAKYYVDKFNALHKDKKNKLGYKVEAFVLDGKDVKLWKEGAKGLDEIAPGYANQGENVSHMISNCAEDRIKIIVRSDGVAAENQDLLEEPFEDVFEAIEEADALPENALEEPSQKYRPIFLSTNAITLSNKIQLIVRFHGSPEEIHANYDFVHCTNYWLSEDNRLSLKQGALEATLAKELLYVGSKYPLCSIMRMRKFLKRGWHINAGQILKILFQVSLLDLTNIAILEDQLIGVDSAYFMHLISALQKKQNSDEAFVINYEYVSTIIDKIFN